MTLTGNAQDIEALLQLQQQETVERPALLSLLGIQPDDAVPLAGPIDKAVA
jgi:hypothetical protein